MKGKVRKYIIAGYQFTLCRPSRSMVFVSLNEMKQIMEGIQLRSQKIVKDGESTNGDDEV